MKSRSVLILTGIPCAAGRQWARSPVETVGVTGRQAVRCLCGSIADTEALLHIGRLSE